MNFQARWLSVILLMCAAGCGQGDGKKASQADVPDWLNKPAGSAAVAAAPAGATLSLKLRPGEQFPLRKVVEQQLQQTSANSQPRYDRSRLEVLFGITVQAQEAGRTQLTVRYDRVKYQHDVAGEHVEFDSKTPPAQIPVALVAYQDMVGDGFSFWIGADNQMMDVVGLQEFVERTLRRVPADQRENVMLGIDAGSGETGIGNFVDTTIGLLPYNRPATPGETWQRNQHFTTPVPMTASNTYILKELDEKYAVIDVRGSILPSTNVRSTRNQGGLQVNVEGGTMTGSCTIYRDTGLPRDSRIDRKMDMTVSLAGAVQFRQVKHVVTLVESYPHGPETTTVLGESSPRAELVTR